MRPKRSFSSLAAFAAPFLLWAGALAATQSDTGLGAQAAPFLTWPADARTASMAQAGVASVCDVNAANLNPSGLGGVDGGQFSLNQAFLFQGSALENAAAAMELFPKAALGVSATYFNVGSVDRADAEGNVTGSFNPYYYDAGLTYAQDVAAGLALGASLKAVGQNIAGAGASTAAVDLGLQYATALEGLRLGASFQNLGAPLAGFQLPELLRAGASYKTLLPGRRNSLLVDLDFQVPQAAARQATASAGAELRCGRFLCLRAGYQSGDFGGVTGLTGLTAGAGFGMNWWQVDYAWVPEGDLGLADQFSFSAKF